MSGVYGTIRGDVSERNRRRGSGAREVTRRRVLDAAQACIRFGQYPTASACMARLDFGLSTCSRALTALTRSGALVVPATLQRPTAAQACSARGLDGSDMPMVERRVAAVRDARERLCRPLTPEELDAVLS